MLRGELGQAVWLLGFLPGLHLLGFVFPVISWSILADGRAGRCVRQGCPIVVNPVGNAISGRGGLAWKRHSVADVVFYEGRYTSI